eukprot:1350785-Amorphochlora_amoeboformis.AAC.2
MEMDRAIIPGLLTAPFGGKASDITLYLTTVGAGLLTAWYFNREQRRKDQESIRRLEEQTASLEAEIRSLKAAVGEHKLKLAMWQAKHVNAMLKRLRNPIYNAISHPSPAGLETEIVGMKTMGDI